MSQSLKNGFNIISREEQPDMFLSAISRFDITAEQFNLTLKYRNSVADEKFHDLSFYIAQNNDIKLIVPCHKTGNVLHFNNAPLCFFGDTQNKKIIRLAYDELIRCGKEIGAKSIAIADHTTERALSVTGSEAFQRDGIPICRLESAIDLSQNEETIKSHLRESYKSLINQTRRDMAFTVLSQDNADRKLFDDFKQFHLKVSGRQTRPEESWNVQFEMIEAGCAEVVLGHVEPHGLVSSALFTDLGKTTTYAVAVYDRELFKQRSLAHANVYEGIIRAKNRGQQRFLLGNVAPRGTVTEKEYSIGIFKKGFSHRLDSYIEWQIPIMESGT